MAPATPSAARLLGLTIATGAALAGGILIGHYAWGKTTHSRSGATPAQSNSSSTVAASAGGGAPAPVKGGVDLTHAKLMRLLHAPATPSTTAAIDAADRCSDADYEAPGCRPERSAQAAALPVISTPNTRETAKVLPQTPAPTKSWKAAFNGKAGYPADAQIAVSSTAVIVSNRQQLRYYDKNGVPLANPISSGTFYSGLNLKDAAGNAIDRFNDVRLIFDEYRKRFWAVTYAYTSVANVPASKQRYYIAVAVSKDENPLNGWYLYYWDGASQQGDVTSTIWKGGDAPDYPIVGIDPVAITTTNAVNDVNGNFKYWKVALYPASSLASGVFKSGWQFWDLKNPDGSVPWVVAPAVHHGNPGSYSFWTGRQGANGLVVWRLKDPLQATQSLSNVAVTLQAWSNPVNGSQKGSTKVVKATNLGTATMESVWRNGLLYTVTNDARDWGGIGVVRTSLRFVRLNVTGYPNVPAPPGGNGVDRVFGGGNVLSDVEGNKYYMWPGVEVNQYGDAIIGYARTGDQLWPEMRASAYLANENDVRPSRQVKAGDQALDNPNLPGAGAILPFGDTAGSSVDPADNTSIWVAQEYSSSTADGNGNYDVWVAKFFGG